MNKKILEALMESPLYFTYLLPDRKLLLQRVSRQTSSNSNLRERLLKWVKTGTFERR